MVRVLALDHELIHAWHYMSGRAAPWIPYLAKNEAGKEQMVLVSDGRWLWGEEYTTIADDSFSPRGEQVTENILRQDLNGIYGYAISPRQGASQSDFERGLPAR
jgi:hypothetical protein